MEEPPPTCQNRFTGDDAAAEDQTFRPGHTWDLVQRHQNDVFDVEFPSIWQ